MRQNFAPRSRFLVRMSSDITMRQKTAHDAKYEVKILADLDNDFRTQNRLRQKFAPRMPPKSSERENAQGNESKRQG